MSLPWLRINLANFIAVAGGDTIAHEVRQSARCNNCGVKDNNMYPNVYMGNSGIAKNEAGQMRAYGYGLG